MNDVIKINLFGSIRLTKGTVTINEKQIHSQRLLALLAYLILHRNSRVSNDTLCKQFIGEKCTNPVPTLRNLVHRLRVLLQVFGPEEFICTLQDEYRWNPNIPIDVDYERFGQLHMQICAEQDSGRKKELCREALRCCGGNFSPVIANERWIISSFVQNQAQYIETVNILGKIYEEEHEWGLLEKLCRDALVQEPFEEDFHSQLIRSLQRQKKFSQAMDHYETAKKIFYENFGIWDPEKLQAAFGRGSQELMEKTIDLAGLQEECSESEEPRDAFFCDYQTFQQIYRVEARRISRVGISEYVLLLTVRRQGSLWEKTVVDAGMTFGIETLEQVVRRTLRIGDVVARSSQTQFVVLLSSCSYEAGVMVAERIYRSFKKKMRNQKLDLRYELREITSLQQQEVICK